LKLSGECCFYRGGGGGSRRVFAHSLAWWQYMRDSRSLSNLMGVCAISSVCFHFSVVTPGYISHFWFICTPYSRFFNFRYGGLTNNHKIETMSSTASPFSQPPSMSIQPKSSPAWKVRPHFISFQLSNVMQSCRIYPAFLLTCGPRHQDPHPERHSCAQASHSGTRASASLRG
jgi:hypothetical protein